MLQITVLTAHVFGNVGVFHVPRAQFWFLFLLRYKTGYYFIGTNEMFLFVCFNTSYRRFLASI